VGQINLEERGHAGMQQQGVPQGHDVGSQYLVIPLLDIFDANGLHVQDDASNFLEIAENEGSS